MLIFDSVAHVVLGLDTNSFPCFSSKFKRKLRFRLCRSAVYHVRDMSQVYRILFDKDKGDPF